MGEKGGELLRVEEEEELSHQILLYARMSPYNGKRVPVSSGQFCV